MARCGQRSARSRPRSAARLKTLRRWKRQAEIDNGEHKGVTSAECEVKALRPAHAILLKASAYFAQAELDRRVT